MVAPNMKYAAALQIAARQLLAPGPDGAVLVIPSDPHVAATDDGMWVAAWVHIPKWRIDVAALVLGTAPDAPASVILRKEPPADG